MMKKVEDGSVLSIREKVAKAKGAGDPFGMLQDPGLRATVIRATYRRWIDGGDEADLEACRELIANEASLAEDGYGDARNHLDAVILGV